MVSQRKQDAISRDTSARAAPKTLGRRYGYLRLDSNPPSNAIHGGHKGNHGRVPINLFSEARRDGVFRGCLATSNNNKYSSNAVLNLTIKGLGGLAKPMPISLCAACGNATGHRRLLIDRRGDELGHSGYTRPSRETCASLAKVNSGVRIFLQNHLPLLTTELGWNATPYFTSRKVPIRRRLEGSTSLAPPGDLRYQGL